MDTYCIQTRNSSIFLLLGQLYYIALVCGGLAYQPADIFICLRGSKCKLPNIFFQITLLTIKQDLKLHTAWYFVAHVGL